MLDSEAANLASLGKGKILLVDDQPLNIKILHQLFHQEFEMYMATSGEQAIEVCRKVKPDLVLLDIEMPGITGFEVCETLKADPLTATTAIIFVTAHFDEEQEARGFQVGAVDFIHKPINSIITSARVQNQFLLKRQSDVLRSFALIDSLTGLPNRRQFELSLPESWRHCIRYNKPLTLMMLDVDFFKHYNDAYGHQKGDDCLRIVAKAIASITRRPYDVVARYGGEEFICIFPDTTLDGGLSIAKKMISAVEALAIEHKGSRISSSVTISAGVASVCPSQNLTWQSVIEEADKQLYQAKENGRNRVCGVAVK
ncbi:diguanylate cyclase domain-containing protein [Shewanella psychrotolerans]|uniref:diguanylate cyclase domain-containing protein n=1 Tax=Shewanella psychrotolerans TaxID=2864206 RepID=UPI001C65D5A7|nr:diguanylate cyclase [Shewanella psychrotolerans]QYK01253.1 diguanylate cyclase [Shewanella psychrotolerans]